MGARKITLITLLKARYPTLDEKELFAAILRGDVIVAGEKAVKPGARVRADAGVRMRGRPRYVSRGGEKLAEALDQWGIPCSGLVWIDAGCSTGGFTDCLLQRGAALVYAVDVGDGQLDWRLRGDPRVRPMEGTNIMAVSRADLHPLPEGAVADLSFRSLRGAARHILGLTSGGWGIFLVKPQFELCTPTPDFHGVVRDQALVRTILRDLAARLAEEGVFAEKALSSPIKGRKGNREFLFFLRAGRDMKGPDADAILSGLVLE